MAPSRQRRRSRVCRGDLLTGEPGAACSSGEAGAHKASGGRREGTLGPAQQQTGRASALKQGHGAAPWQQQQRGVVMLRAGTLEGEEIERSRRECLCRLNSEIGCALAQSNLFSPLFSESTPDEMLSGPVTTSDDCAGRVRLPTPEPEGSGAPSEIRFSHVHNSISSDDTQR